MRSVARLTRIMYRGKFFDYPIKASNALLNLGPFEAAHCLLSYAQARLHPVVEPKSFEDWVSNQFGHRLFEIFFKTYTEKSCGAFPRANCRRTGRASGFVGSTWSK